MGAALVPALQAGEAFSARGTRASARDARSSPGYNRTGLRPCGTDARSATNNVLRRRLTVRRAGPTWSMTARRRKWIIVAALVGIVAALAWCFGRGDGKLKVKLMFVGFTNDSTSGAKALVLASNSGSAKALLIAYGNGGLPGPLEPELFGFFSFPSDVGVPFPSSGNAFPAQLEPGES